MHFASSLEPLRSAEGGPSHVIRTGRTVRREARPWTGTVHALLRHLAEAGFTGCPRVVGDGLDEVVATAWSKAQLHDDVAGRNNLPDSADPVPLWALAWRARAAGWMIRHRACWRAPFGRSGRHPSHLEAEVRGSPPGRRLEGRHPGGAVLRPGIHRFFPPEPPQSVPTSPQGPPSMI
ncbi:hypothetical protein Psi01_81190 [Planobispora siamensis]|uniref:Uncharacterized protein n=1 Tax=Planobispora siamensis TaxID=936338 RepID=A0A8J3WNJ1_9ACTN|nr:hypothetical protein Psi01_81190 [Planobispora siamensis]